MSTDNQLPIFDPATLQQLKELVDGDDASFLRDLYESYLTTARENIQLLKDESDPTVLRRAAHTLKGSSLNVGAARVADLCKQLEQTLVAQSPPDMLAQLAVIENGVQQVAEAYNQALVDLVRNGSAG